MLNEFRQRMRERRGQYSVRRHVARLKREGRLPQIAAAAVAVLIVAGVSFGRCQPSSITAPSDEALQSSSSRSVVASGSLAPASDVYTFREKTVQRNVIFTGVNPCNGDAVRLEGTRYEKIRISAGVGYFDTHHKIRDSCMRGYAINEPKQKYKGTDEHEHHMKVTTAGLDDEMETEEELIALGPEPDWKLKLYQRYKARYDDPLDMRVEFRARASCAHECSIPGGCIDRDFTFVSADEFPINELPELP
jgi:hypothetical protein